MNTINLVIGLHNHQPVGNFDFVFEEAYQRAYLPFLQVLSAHPGVRTVQHYSGILLEWILSHHPDFISLLSSMVSRGQIEIMTGGYYEPILIAISDPDKVGQIRKLDQFLRKHLDCKPRGIWLAERVWEPQLPLPLVQAGVEYTVLDDSHFKHSGLSGADLQGYFITEEQGALLKVFPIDEKLRYSIPFQPPEETIAYLQSLADSSGDRIAVFADDGEKFGVWPNTYHQCYENGWLESFFSLLEENREWIRVLTFAETLDRFAPRGRVYLPTASYREMMTWALPAAAIPEYENMKSWLEQAPLKEVDRFFQAGFWRNFFAKYPEANQMHKRMLQVRDDLKRLESDPAIPPSLLEPIRDLVYAAQCNCPYWHGVFGGLYLTNLRYAIYNHLIRAQVAIDRLIYAKEAIARGWVRIEQKDVNCDGFEETFVDTDRMRLYFAPAKGGTLFEWDFKPCAINLLDTLSRRPEGYHHKLSEAGGQQADQSADFYTIHENIRSQESGLQDLVDCDSYQRVALIDHFLHPETDLDGFSRTKYREQGDFIEQPYQVQVEKTETSARLMFSREGQVQVDHGKVPMHLDKTIEIKAGSDSIGLTYRLHNRNNRSIEIWFAAELAFNLLAGEAVDRYYATRQAAIDDRCLRSRGSIADLAQFSLVDEWLGLHINLDFAPRAEVWRFPIETVSMSESGFERIYQASVVVPNWKILLPPQASKQMEIQIELHKLE
ncbi:MAG TPA: DUF1926 domain-containing protein [bacterium]|nr:DUF1926 domain-containing protein [bacterium]HNT64265.1 DUF1926 domain-containing protein [bacterium]